MKISLLNIAFLRFLLDKLFRVLSIGSLTLHQLFKVKKYSYKKHCQLQITAERRISHNNISFSPWRARLCRAALACCGEPFQSKSIPIPIPTPTPMGNGVEIGRICWRANRPGEPLLQFVIDNSQLCIELTASVVNSVSALFRVFRGFRG